MAQLWLTIHGTPRNLRSLVLGSAGDKEHTWDCALTENTESGLLGPGKSKNNMAQLGMCLQNTRESEQLGPGKCRTLTANLGLHA